MRRVLSILLIGAGACQCLEPVAEDRDAGVDAGVTDAGRPECLRASDCVPVSPPRECAFASRLPGRSCFDGRCVFDCEGVRTCSTQLSSCLSCDGGVQSCNAESCAFIGQGATGQIFRTCSAGAREDLGSFVVRYRTGATCNFVVLGSDAGVFGALDLLGDYSHGSGAVADEPGVTCTVRGLATALNRIELGCARCLYVLEWI